MSFKLIGVLIALMVVNQIIGTGYGTWKEGFNKQVFWKGVTKVLYLLLGYGVIALTINLAAEFVPQAQYLSGILLEPIAKYFTKACDSLKNLLNESSKDNIATTKQKNNETETTEASKDEIKQSAGTDDCASVLFVLATVYCQSQLLVILQKK